MMLGAVVGLILETRAQAFEEAAEIAREHGDHYPTDIFIEPPPGEHGQTVDACSARAERHASRIIAQAISEAKEGGE